MFAGASDSVCGSNTAGKGSFVCDQKCPVSKVLQNCDAVVEFVENMLQAVSFSTPKNCAVRLIEKVPN